MSVIPPPPTCNLLDNEQRTRLIKSTRKLGKVLGTTPFVLDSSHLSSLLTPPPTPSLQRSRSLSAASDASTRPFLSPKQRSLDATREKYPPAPAPSAAASATIPGSGRSDSARPPVLKLNPIADAPPSSFLALSPSSPHATSPPPPTEPSTTTQSPTPDELGARRRKMDKLVRHLGENVPRELVFPARTGRRRTSVSAPPRTTSSTFTSTSTTTSPTNAAPAARTTARDDAHMRTRSERRQGWSGEWNREDYQDVVARLRALKA